MNQEDREKAINRAELLRQKFWEIIEHDLDVVVPFYLKNIFKWQRLDNHVAISDLEANSVITDLEEFVKLDIYALKIPSGSKFEDYYGPCSENAQNFRFAIGEKSLIKKIFQYVRSAPIDKWKIDPPPESPVAKKKLLMIKALEDSEKVPSVLKLLIESLCQRCDKATSRYRYENDLKLFSAYIRMVGGPIVYETIAANLPVPSIATINKFIRSSAPRVIEGECRIDDLKIFLNERKLPPVVWLSEDATRITGKIQYDSATNQLIGFVLPMGTNSMPITQSFVVNSARDIERAYRDEKQSSLLYVIMAQPIQVDSPPFCLQIFGTDNVFTTKDCINRWNVVTKLLENAGIHVLGISSDGDPRLLRAMRIKTNLGIEGPSNWSIGGDTVRIREYNAEMSLNRVYVQDTVHIGTKLRNRLLKFSIVLPMGHFLVSRTHLRILIKKTSKDKHLLSEKDLDNADKMNFESVVKISNGKVIRLLKERIPDSLATQTYLRIIDNVLQSFLCPSLTVKERVYKIWFSIFFLRLWRSWLRSIKSYSITDNFITSNTYICIEINGHSLIQLIFYCIENNCFEQFIPFLFSSQPCESFFRILRSMSTSYSTIVNCTVLEAINRLRKIQLQEDILNHHFEQSGINFPRKKVLQSSFESKKYFTGSGSPGCQPTISVKEVYNTLSEAKNDAYNLANDLGMKIQKSEANVCQIQRLKSEEETNMCDESELQEYYLDDIHSENQESQVSTETVNQNKRDCDILQDDDEPLEDEMTFLSEFLKSEENFELKDYTDNKGILQLENWKSSPFIYLKTRNGEKKLVRKSAICWLFNKGKVKISSDRLQRVKDNEKNIGKKIDFCSNRGSNSIETINVCDEVLIGDWCVFKKIEGDGHLIGLVLEFSYMDEKTWKNIEFSNLFAKVRGNSKPVGVLCAWYAVSETLQLCRLLLDVQGHIEMKNYKFTIKEPSERDEVYVLDKNVYNEIKNLL